MRQCSQCTLSDDLPASANVRVVVNVTDYVAEDGSNNIAVTVDVADIETMKASMASPPPEVAALMEKHAVPPITLYIEA